MNPIVTNYITTTEFANFNPETDMSGYTDATLSGMIARASAYVDNYLNYSLGIGQVQNEIAEAVVSSDGALVIYVSKYPVQSVQTINLLIGSYTVGLTLTDGLGVSRVQLPFRGRSIVYPYQELAWTGTMSIRNFFDIRNRDVYTQTSYTAGYATIPNDLKDAVNLLTKEIFMRQANPQNLSYMTQGAIRVQFKDILRDDGKSLNVIQADNILNAYKRVF